MLEGLIEIVPKREIATSGLRPPRNDEYKSGTHRADYSCT